MPSSLSVPIYMVGNKNDTVAVCFLPTNISMQVKRIARLGKAQHVTVNAKVAAPGL